MRLTLWQQFSSNHSASFSVVGKFDTAEKAEQVAEELRGILHKILSWWQEHSFPAWGQSGAPSPIEIELSKQYNVQWCRHVGSESDEPTFMDFLRNEKDIPQHVNVFENHVLVRNYHETTVTSAPFKELLERRGAVISGSEGRDVNFVLVVKATATGDFTADMLMDDIKYRPNSGRGYNDEAYLVADLLLTGKPVREGNTITYRFDDFADEQPYELPWNKLIKMREYLTALDCIVDYYFEE
jgi:hypothetical protein